MRQIHLVRDPIRHLFLDRSVLIAVPARPVKLKLRVSVKLIVRRPLEGIAAAVPVRRGESRCDIRTARENGARIVDHAMVPKNESDVVQRIIQVVASVPRVVGRLRHPKPIRREAAGVNGVTKSDQAFARRRVVRKARCCRPRHHLVRCLDIKRHQNICRLPRKCRRIKPVTRHGVSARSVVDHGHRQNRRRIRIQPILQLHRRNAIGIVHARRNHHRFVRRGHWRIVRHRVNRRAGVRDCAAVPRARCAEIGGQIHFHRRFQPIAVQPEQHFRVTFEPAHLRANRVCHSRRLGSGQRGADAVHLVVAASRAPNMVRSGAVVTFARLQAGLFLRPLCRPTCRVRLEGPVGNQVRPCRIAHFHALVVERLCDQVERIIAVRICKISQSRRAFRRIGAVQALDNRRQHRTSVGAD